MDFNVTPKNKVAEKRMPWIKRRLLNGPMQSEYLPGRGENSKYFD